MGIVTKFKKMFGKTIALEGQQNGLVVMYPLKKGLLKINSEIIVKEGFGLQVCRFDTLCDYLSEGTYRVSLDDMPKLSKYAKPYKTKKGEVSPKNVKADLYYINFKEFKNKAYKTAGKIRTMHNNKKINITFSGTFDFQITDGKIFIRSLLRDHAILKPGVAERDIASFVGNQIYLVLNKYVQELITIINKENSVSEMINKFVGEEAKNHGITITNIMIKDIKIPKHLQPLSDGKINEEKQAEELEEKLANLLNDVKVGQEVQNINSELDYIYASGVQEKSQNAKQAPAAMPPRAPDHYEQYSQNMVGCTPPENYYQPPPQILTEEPPPPTELYNDFCDGDNNKKAERIIITETEEAQSKSEIINNKKYCAFCGGEVGKTKFCPHCGKPTATLITCSSCGAKNETGAKECMVCKSKI